MKCCDCGKERIDLGVAGNCSDCQMVRLEKYLETCRVALEGASGKRPAKGTRRRKLWDFATAAYAISVAYGPSPLAILFGKRRSR